MKSNLTLLKKRLLELVLIRAKIKRVNVEWLGYCVTCYKRGHRTTMNGGHFIPQSKGDSCRFELDNVNLQCSSCNGKGNQWEQFKHGLRIDSNYHAGRANELHDQSRTLKKWKPQEIEEKIREVEILIMERYWNQTIRQQKILVEYMKKNTERKAACKNLLIMMWDTLVKN